MKTVERWGVVKDGGATWLMHISRESAEAWIQAKRLCGYSIRRVLIELPEPQPRCPLPRVGEWEWRQEETGAFRAEFGTFHIEVVSYELDFPVASLYVDYPPSKMMTTMWLATHTNVAAARTAAERAARRIWRMMNRVGAK